MSVGSEFQRSDAATGKERRPTVVSRNGGTSSCSEDEERSRLLNEFLSVISCDYAEYFILCVSVI